MSAQRRRAGPSERADETRRRILAGASELFAERGYAATSLSDLLKATGVTKGGFYFHFPSKARLALAVLEYKREQWAGRVLTAAMDKGEALEQLRALATAFCELYQSDSSYRVLGRLYFELAAEQPDLVPQLRPHFTQWSNLVASLVRSAQAQGDVRADVDADAVAEIAVASFLGMTELSFFSSDGADLNARMSHFIEFFEAGLRPPSRSPS